MPDTQPTATPHAAYFAARRARFARLMADGPRPGHALSFRTRDSIGFHPSPEEVPIASVRAKVRSARKLHTVHEYDATTRDGAQVHIAYIRYAEDFWTNAPDVMDVYEIPADTLAAL